MKNQLLLRGFFSLIMKNWTTTQEEVEAAAIDELSEERIHPGNPILKSANCLITNNIAWASKEKRTHLMDIAARNLSAFLEGNPTNVIS